MRKPHHRVSLPFLEIFTGVLAIDCQVSSSNVAGDGGPPDDSGSGSIPGYCNSTLFDNGNGSACTKPTDTSTFTLTAGFEVSSIELWVDTSVAGASLQYTLKSATGTTVGSGALEKGSCDPYQTNWCQMTVHVGSVLAAGTYTVKSSAVATCSNSGSSNIGFVKVVGCASGTMPGTGGSSGAGGSFGTGGAVTTGGAFGSGGSTGAGGGFVGSCMMTTTCVDYITYPANIAGDLITQCASLYKGTWSTSPCSGTWCGTCSMGAGTQISYASHYTGTTCGGNLATLCASGGGVFTAN
jgi:hypothetical protein